MGRTDRDTQERTDDEKRVDKDRGGERVKSMAGEDEQPGLESSTVGEQMKDVR